MSVTVVVGVDGAGRTRRLDEIAGLVSVPVVRLSPSDNRLPENLPAGCLVLVDDAHRFDVDGLRALTGAARAGVAMVVSRRPTIDSRELADLDEAVSARGVVEQIAPLDVDGVAALVAVVTGRPAPPELAAEVFAASAGLPAVAAAVATASPGVPSPSLIARVQRRLALLDAPVVALARLLALRLDLADGVLASASDMDGSAYAAAMRVLRDNGLLVPAGEAMIPAVAEALLAELPAAERRRVHDAVARALVAHGGDPLTAAVQLRAARAFIPAAAGVYLAVGDRSRFEDPAAAIGWYDDALEAGADPALVAVGRAEAAALLGLPVDTAGDDRLALVDGAVEAHEGRTDRSAEALSTAPPPGPALAVPGLVATGRIDPARAAAVTAAPPGLRRMAEAALAAAVDPAAAVPLLIEAAEAVERTPPTVVLPDTPHALGALAAATAGDAGSAEHLLQRALAAGVGGPVAVDRHRLLLAWVRMRTGRYDTAVAELARLAEAPLHGRERLLLAALSAGIARRSGDVARLRDAWASVEPVLARRAVDLFTAEAVEELAVAATRLRRQVRVGPVLEALDTIVDGLGRPPAWVVTVGWIRVQMAASEEDGRGLMACLPSLESAAAQAGPRQRAQWTAARLWADVLNGTVDAEAVTAAAEDLAAVELPWEGSRLVGQAAIRTTDAAAARRLLERARELSSAEVAAVANRTESQHGGLSEREVEVARMVLDGGTYREIGSRLFISPKTVEHHVARIRTKLGATTRAEFVAALRETLGPS